LATLYSGAPIWLQNVAVTAYGVHLRRLRYGGIHGDVLRALTESQWAPAAYHRERQLKALNDLLRLAAARVPFYADRRLPAGLRTLDALAELPVLRKQDVQRAGDRLVDRTVPERRTVRVYTGGTTGTALTVYADRSALRRNYAFFARFRAWAGIPPGARTATFAGRTVVPIGQRNTPFWRLNMAASTLLCSSYHLAPDTVDAYLDRLGAFRPALIDSYPSSIEPLARRMLETGRTDIRPTAVITSSETLVAAMRDVIERAFGCAVFDHYGAAEMATLITQCERGTYHVNPEFGIVEIVRENGERAGPGVVGEIVATGFVNPVMPLIRYGTGDLAAWGETLCACGRAFPVVAELYGRMDDVIVTPEGRRVGRLDPIFKGLSSLRETRIVQDAPDHVRVEVVPAGQLLAVDRALLLDELTARLGSSMRIDIVPVATIPRAASGKLRTVVNALNERTDPGMATVRRLR
jgi:phenylacetate-CoA ligase